MALTWPAQQLILFGISTHETSRPSVNYPPPPTSLKPLQRPLTLRVSCWKKFNSISKHPLSHLVDAHRASYLPLICFHPLKQHGCAGRYQYIFHIISKSAKLWNSAPQIDTSFFPIFHHQRVLLTFLPLWNVTQIFTDSICLDFLFSLNSTFEMWPLRTDDSLTDDR